jgi:type IX secretion system PorP/SprF family membrane protein
MGMALHHVAQPNESMLTDDAQRPLKFSIHGGGKFKMLRRPEEEKDQIYLTPTFNYRAQGKFDQLDIGVYYTKTIWNFGLWYRGLPGLKPYKEGYPNNDALCFIIGVSKDRINVGYSYDFTISRLQGNTGGAHELSFAYQFCKLKRKKKKNATVICPKF